MKKALFVIGYTLLGKKERSRERRAWSKENEKNVVRYSEIRIPHSEHRQLERG